MDTTLADAVFQSLTQPIAPDGSQEKHLSRMLTCVALYAMTLHREQSSLVGPAVAQAVQDAMMGLCTAVTTAPDSQSVYQATLRAVRAIAAFAQHRAYLDRVSDSDRDSDRDSVSATVIGGASTAPPSIQQTPACPPHTEPRL